MEVNIFELIREWARARGIDKADPYKQLRKLAEEFGEVANAMTKENTEGLLLEIGDMVVVLTNLAMIYGLDIEDCITAAYTKIEKRSGKMIDGVFVKVQDLPAGPIDLDEGSEE